MASEPCPECGETKANAGALHVHRIAKHRIAKGTCDWCSREYVNLPAHQRKCPQRPLAGDADPAPGGPPIQGVVDAAPGDGDAYAPGEVAPQVGPTFTPTQPTPAGGGGRMDRLRARLWDRKDKAPPANGAGAPPGTGSYSTPTERAPRPRSKARKSTAGLLGMGWGGLGTLLVNTRADVPVGRVLQFQSEAAGHAFDRFFAGGMIDRLVLQRMAEREEEFTDLAGIVLLPALVGAYERVKSPEAARQLEPFMRQALMASIVAMGPAVKQRQADEKKMAVLIRDLIDQGIMPDVPPGPQGQAPDYAGAMLDLIFSPVPSDPAPAPPADAPEPAATG